MRFSIRACGEPNNNPPARVSSVSVGDTTFVNAALFGREGGIEQSPVTLRTVFGCTAIL